MHAYGASDHGSGGRRGEVTKLKAVYHFVVGAKHQFGTHSDSLAAQRVAGGIAPSGLKMWWDAELEGANFFCLEALLTLGHLELHALPFGQAAEAIGLDGGVMDENVLTALALDETKTFGIVKPLHCSLFHL
jgi:hypothetical protein